MFTTRNLQVIWPDFDKIFEDLASRFNGLSESTDVTGIFHPRSVLKTKSDGSGVTAKLILPGYDKDDLKITIKNSRITVECEKEDADKGVFKFKKVYGLADTFDQTGVKAEMKNGVLLLHIPYKKQDGSVDAEIPIE